ncbi:uncharacterized protein DAT39_002219, partial [Clarias magur]
HNKFGLPSGIALCIFDDTNTEIEEDILHKLLQAKPDIMLTVRDSNTELEMFRSKNTLTSETRRVLVNILVGHMVEMHGRIPTWNQRAVCSWYCDSLSSIVTSILQERL